MKTILFVAFLTLSAISIAEEIGRVDTNIRFTGENDHIAVEAFDDPQIKGVTCHLSRAKRGKTLSNFGGLTQADSSDSSLACRQVGPIVFPAGGIKEKQKVFKKRQSPFFKTMQVIRFIDKKRNTLVYLVYSDKIKDGSPKNSISTVPIIHWDDSIKPDIKWADVIKK